MRGAGCVPPPRDASSGKSWRSPSLPRQCRKQQPGSRPECPTIAPPPTAHACWPISTRCAPSAPTRPACTSRPFPSRMSRSLQWLAQKLPEAGLAAEIDGIGNVLGTSTKAGPKLLAGSHLESQNYAGWLDGPLGVIYALEAARVLNPDPAVKGAVEVASWCDEEGHFGSFLGSRSYVGAVSEADIDAARDRNADRSMRASPAKRRPCRPPSPPGAGRPPHRLSRGPYRTGRDAGKRPAQDRHRHLHRRHLAVPHHLCRRAEPCRHHADGDPQGRRPCTGALLRRDRRELSQRSADRARCGPPAASRSIPAHPASFPAAPRCCSRSAMSMLP